MSDDDDDQSLAELLRQVRSRSTLTPQERWEVSAMVQRVEGQGAAPAAGEPRRKAKKGRADGGGGGDAGAGGADAAGDAPPAALSREVLRKFLDLPTPTDAAGERGEGATRPDVREAFRSLSARMKSSATLAPRGPGTDGEPHGKGAAKPDVREAFRSLSAKVKSSTTPSPSPSPPASGAPAGWLSTPSTSTTTSPPSGLSWPRTRTSTASVPGRDSPPASSTAGARAPAGTPAPPRPGTDGGPPPPTQAARVREAWRAESALLGEDARALREETRRLGREAREKVRGEAEHVRAEAGRATREISRALGRSSTSGRELLSKFGASLQRGVDAAREHERAVHAGGAGRAPAPARGDGDASPPPDSGDAPSEPPAGAAAKADTENRTSPTKKGTDDEVEAFDDIAL